MSKSLFCIKIADMIIWRLQVLLFLEVVYLLWRVFRLCLANLWVLASKLCSIRSSLQRGMMKKRHCLEGLSQSFCPWRTYAYFLHSAGAEGKRLVPASQGSQGCTGYQDCCPEFGECSSRHTNVGGAERRLHRRSEGRGDGRHDRHLQVGRQIW